MRAGTSMPGLALGGISQMQSPAGTTLVARLSDVFMSALLLDVDHESRVPAALDPLQRELVERHGLGVGAEGGALGIDGAALDLGAQMKGPSPPTRTWQRVNTCRSRSLR